MAKIVGYPHRKGYRNSVRAFAALLRSFIMIFFKDCHILTELNYLDV